MLSPGISFHGGDKFTNYSTMIILLFLAWLMVLILAFQVIKPDLQRKLQKKRRASRKTKYHRRSNSYLAKAIRASNNSPGYAGAWHQLLKLVNFDVGLAERLVNQCKWRNPDKNDRWCIEKVIYDLERDRNRN